MAKSLVIVESPAKAKTINKYLGKDFVVKSSVGHIRDLPTKAQGKVPAKKPAKELNELIDKWNKLLDSIDKKYMPTDKMKKSIELAGASIITDIKKYKKEMK